MCFINCGAGKIYELPYKPKRLGEVISMYFMGVDIDKESNRSSSTSLLDV